MAQLKDLIVNGPGRILSDLYVQNKIYENGEALEDKYDEIVYVDITATFSDIYNLKQNGKLPIYKDANGFAFPELIADSSPTEFTFTKIDDSGTIYWYKVDTSDVWTNGTKSAVDLYWCGYGSTTYASVTSALSAGKLPVLLYNNYLSVYSLTSSNVHYFLAWVSSSGSIVRYSLSSSNSWAASNITLQPKYLVSSWQATPDDTHYPSEKLVYNSLASKVSEPSSEGTNGQVLTTDGSGGRSWTTVSGGSSNLFIANYNSTTYSAISAAKAANKIILCSPGNINGYALLSDFEAPSSGGHGISIYDEGFWFLTLQATTVPTTNISVVLHYSTGDETVTVPANEWGNDGTSNHWECYNLPKDPYEDNLTSVTEVGASPASGSATFSSTKGNKIYTYTVDLNDDWSWSSVTVPSASVSTTVTLSSSGWSETSSGSGIYSQGVTPSSGGSSIDPLEYSIITVSPQGDPSAYANAGIWCDHESYYLLDFRCTSVPTSNIVVNVVLT